MELKNINRILELAGQPILEEEDWIEALKKEYGEGKEPERRAHHFTKPGFYLSMFTSRELNFYIVNQTRSGLSPSLVKLEAANDYPVGIYKFKKIIQSDLPFAAKMKLFHKYKDSGKIRVVE